MDLFVNDNVYDQVLNRHFERRVLRDHHNPFLEEPNSFKKKYRLFPAQAIHLCNLLHDDLASEVHNNLPVHVQLLSALRLFASGSYQNVIADADKLQTSQSSVSRSFNKVVVALVRLAPNWIKFPRTRQQREVAQASYQHTIRIPGILGLIDCTIIKLLKPSENEEAFVNRKHLHSLNVQVVSNMDGLIMDIRVCPGATNDRMVWAHCNLKRYMESIRANFPQEMNYYLLGDGGYTRSQIMLIPHPEAHPETPEALYNSEHAKTRCRVEMGFASWHNSMRVNKRERAMRYVPKKAAEIITAAAVLHNYILLEGIKPPADDVENIFYANDNVEVEDFAAGEVELANIIEIYYT